MSSDLFDLAAAISRAQAPSPVLQVTNRARATAINLVGEHPYATTVEVASIAYLQGRVDALNDHLNRGSRVMHDNDAACSRCGKTVRAAGIEPLDPLRSVICMDCSNLNERPS